MKKIKNDNPNNNSHETYSTSEKVKQKWGEFFTKRQQKQENMHMVLWMDSPIVREYVNETYIDFKDSFFSFFKSKYVPECSFKKGLELGCGNGLPTLSFSTVVQYIDAYDISDEAINLAKKNALEKGIKNINFNVMDLNQIGLPHNEYDVVFFNHALHHFDALERIFSEVAKSLKPGGIVFIDDYIGPNRLQWKQREYAIMTEIDNILPDKYRMDSLHENQVRSEVEIITLEAFEPDWPGGDPSEAVRSEEIIPVLKKFFEIIEEKPQGGTILHGLLQGIIHNFNPEDETDTAILRLICLIEKLMLKEAGLESYFKGIVACKRN